MYIFLCFIMVFAGKFCDSSNMPGTLVSSDSRMWIEYRSSGMAGYRGFKADYEGMVFFKGAVPLIILRCGGKPQILGTPPSPGILYYPTPPSHCDPTSGYPYSSPRIICSIFYYILLYSNVFYNAKYGWVGRLHNRGMCGCGQGMSYCYWRKHRKCPVHK